MPISFRQTDTVGACTGTGGLCVRPGNSSGTNPRTAVDGGTAGSSPVTGTVEASASGPTVIRYEITPGFTTWASGDWTVRVNCTTANMNISISSVEVCRRTSTCETTGATLHTLDGLSVSLGSTGVKTINLTGVSGATAGATDIIVVSIHVSNSAMSSQNVGITPDQLIDTPLEAGGAVDSSFPYIGGGYYGG